MFAFRKKNKETDQIDHLFSLLKNDPENTKNRLKLADLYLRAGDKKSAIREYQTAATYLREDGFNLKAISIYKKLFTLDGMSLSDYRSLASIYAESGLLTEARRTYEKILQMKPQDRETQDALNELERDDETPLERETKNNIEDPETPAIDDSDAVPIETLLAPSHAQEPRPGPPSDHQPGTLEGIKGDDLSDNRETPEVAAPPDHGEDPRIDMGVFQIDDFLETSQPPHEKEPAAGDSFHGKLLRDLDLSDLSDDREATGEGPSTNMEEDSHIDIANPQTDDPSETTPPLPETMLDPADFLDGNVLPDPTVDDMANAFTPSEKTASHPIDPSTFDSPQTTAFTTSETRPDPAGTDPDLHYHLGVAYREMDLTDRAIEEFTKSLEDGNKPLECLIVLAKCYFEKGLFQEAAGFVHRALKLKNLTQDQIDQLHRQLEEAEAVGNLG